MISWLSSSKLTSLVMAGEGRNITLLLGVLTILALCIHPGTWSKPIFYKNLTYVIGNNHNLKKTKFLEIIIIKYIEYFIILSIILFRPNIIADLFRTPYN